MSNAPSMPRALPGAMLDDELSNARTYVRTNVLTDHSPNRDISRSVTHAKNSSGDANQGVASAPPRPPKLAAARPLTSGHCQSGGHGRCRVLLQDAPRVECSCQCHEVPPPVCGSCGQVILGGDS